MNQKVYLQNEKLHLYNFIDDKNDEDDDDDAIFFYWFASLSGF